jgi:hypothetical protein
VRRCLTHRHSPRKRSAGRRSPYRSSRSCKRGDGRIDRSKGRDNPWDPLARKGRWRVWNSRRGKPSWPAVTSRNNRPDIWMQAIRSDLEKLLVARGPSTYGSRPSQGRRCGDMGSRSRGAIRPRFSKSLTLLKQRAQGKPGVRCTRSRACSVGSTRVSHHEFTGNIRLSPRNGFNGLFRALPGDRALLPPSLTDNSANLTPASGCQDHTTSPSASVPFARTLSCTDTVASTASRTQRS